MVEEVGSLFIPNIGHGHLEFKFEKDKPEEVEKAKHVINDMLKRGYSIFIEVDGQLEKVKTFDPKTEMYFIDPPAVEKKKGGRPKGVSMKKTKASAVAPTSGG